MVVVDYYFDYYSDEAPVYFIRRATEFDGVDPQEEEED